MGFRHFLTGKPQYLLDGEDQRQSIFLPLAVK
jgi:hypothetical protein